MFSNLERAALLAAEKAYREFVLTYGSETEGGTKLLDDLEKKLEAGEELDEEDLLLLKETLEYLTRISNETTSSTH